MIEIVLLVLFLAYFGVDVTLFVIRNTKMQRFRLVRTWHYWLLSHVPQPLIDAEAKRGRRRERRLRLVG